MSDELEVAAARVTEAETASESLCLAVEQRACVTERIAQEAVDDSHAYLQSARDIVRDCLADIDDSVVAAHTRATQQMPFLSVECLLRQQDMSASFERVFQTGMRSLQQEVCQPVLPPTPDHNLQTACDAARALAGRMRLARHEAKESAEIAEQLALNAASRSRAKWHENVQRSQARLAAIQRERLSQWQRASEESQASRGRAAELQQRAEHTVEGLRSRAAAVRADAAERANAVAASRAEVMEVALTNLRSATVESQLCAQRADSITETAGKARQFTLLPMLLRCEHLKTAAEDSIQRARSEVAEAVALKNDAVAVAERKALEAASCVEPELACTLQGLTSKVLAAQESAARTLEEMGAAEQRVVCAQDMLADSTRRERLEVDVLRSRGCEQVAAAERARAETLHLAYHELSLVEEQTCACEWRAAVAIGSAQVEVEEMAGKDIDFTATSTRSPEAACALSLRGAVARAVDSVDRVRDEGARLVRLAQDRATAAWEEACDHLDQMSAERDEAFSTEQALKEEAQVAEWRLREAMEETQLEEREARSMADVVQTMLFNRQELMHDLALAAEQHQLSATRTVDEERVRLKRKVLSAEERSTKVLREAHAWEKRVSMVEEATSNAERVSADVMERALQERSSELQAATERESRAECELAASMELASGSARVLEACFAERSSLQSQDQN